MFQLGFILGYWREAFDQYSNLGSRRCSVVFVLVAKHWTSPIHSIGCSGVPGSLLNSSTCALWVWRTLTVSLVTSMGGGALGVWGTRSFAKGRPSKKMQCNWSIFFRVRNTGPSIFWWLFLNLQVQFKKLNVVSHQTLINNYQQLFTAVQCRKSFNLKAESNSSIHPRSSGLCSQGRSRGGHYYKNPKEKKSYILKKQVDFNSKWKQQMKWPRTANQIELQTGQLRQMR